MIWFKSIMEVFFSWLEKIAKEDTTAIDVPKQPELKKELNDAITKHSDRDTHNPFVYDPDDAGLRK